jgi:hypothetical protein
VAVSFRLVCPGVHYGTTITPSAGFVAPSVRASAAERTPEPKVACCDAPRPRPAQPAAPKTWRNVGRTQLVRPCTARKCEGSCPESIFPQRREAPRSLQSRNAPRTCYLRVTRRHLALAGGLLYWVYYMIKHADAYQPPHAHWNWYVAANLSHLGIRARRVRGVAPACGNGAKLCATRHHQITNVHRAGAIGTFHELREAASGSGADAILLQATDAIFRRQPTGFGDESVGARNYVAEMIKMFRRDAAKSSKARCDANW